jgi:glycosyltransferase involved in cell wall biosynthesis
MKFLLKDSTPIFDKNPALIMLKKIFKYSLQKLGYEIKKTAESMQALDKVVTLKPNGVSGGNVLLSYIIEPFLGQDIDSFTSHTHFWESYQIAKTYLDMGYCVDVIDYRNHSFTPKIPYTLFVSARTNFEKIAKKLNDDCIKVVHLDTAHWMFNNSAAYNRYAALQKRRGITVRCKKIIEQTWAIEVANCATVLGNSFTVGTYAYANKPIYQLPVPTCRTYTWPDKKDFEACRNNFIWMGSSGVVNKGLDLVLEAFTELPDCRLSVFGPIDEEKEFEKAYNYELYQSTNIKTIGWVDVNSDLFLDITRNSIALIYPSCSEGQAGAVATCMQTGVIPIVSYESGIDVDDFGILLEKCTIAEIKEAINRVLKMPSKTLALMSRKSWEYAREYHSHKGYAKAYRSVAEKILS